MPAQIVVRKIGSEKPLEKARRLKGKYVSTTCRQIQLDYLALAVREFRNPIAQPRKRAGLQKGDYTADSICSLRKKPSDFISPSDGVVSFQQWQRYILNAGTAEVSAIKFTHDPRRANTSFSAAKEFVGVAITATITKAEQIRIMAAVHTASEAMQA